MLVLFLKIQKKYIDTHDPIKISDVPKINVFYTPIFSIK
jgi:hypothetical protein